MILLKGLKEEWIKKRERKIFKRIIFLSLMETRIKAIALDIYGTVLASDDHENILPPRRGLEMFFDNCDRLGVNVYSTSDADIGNVRSDFESCFRHFEENFGRHMLSIERFSGFYQLNQLPHKDYGVLLRELGLLSSQLLVIGDSSKDVNGANASGCPCLQVPEYRIYGEREFCFESVDLTKF
jgi:phosphoglycolate phosphatase-like HAD superfamily hydrolase